MDLQQLTPADAPYIRVGRDARGGVVWEVVDRGVVIQTPSGPRALSECEARRRAHGLPVP